MTTSVTIGEFSRLSHLSVKALRHYHDIDLLVPAEIDAFTGYRRYAVDQVLTAQLISRLRTLRMPLPDVRTVIAVDDVARRAEVLRDHLLRMEQQLEQTRDVVASLRGLLEPASSPLTVEHRDAPAQDVVAIRSVVQAESITAWCETAFPRLYAGLEAAGITPAGPGGATYAEEFFTEEAGEVVVFVPIPPGARAVGDLDRTQLPAQSFAVALHAGPFVDFDRTYGALGSYVAEQCQPVTGPIREIYLLGPDSTADAINFRTEVCWPIG